MTHKIATVTETKRFDKAEPSFDVTLDCAQPHTPTIRLDSPQWFVWLEAPENDTFSYALHNHAKGYIDGFMTVRKERRQRGGLYWSAYRRQGRRLRKLYLGTSASLTADCLRQAAARLYASEDPHGERAGALSAPAPSPCNGVASDSNATTNSNCNSALKEKNLLSP